MNVIELENRMATNDGTRLILDLVHRLMLQSAGDHGDITDLLRQLQQVFNASGCGIADVSEDRSCIRVPGPFTPEVPPPWNNADDLLTKLQQVNTAICVESSAGCSLITGIPGMQDWILWVEKRSPETFSSADAASLALVACAVNRHLAGGSSARWAEQLDRKVRQNRLEFTAGITRRLAHDFGNILTGILGFTELALNQQSPGNGATQSYLQEVYRAAQAGALYTQQLRLFSRRQSATSRFSHLPSVLAEQEARLFSIQPTGLHLRFQVAEDLPVVSIDAEQIHHVLTALLDNAREALVGTGTISISTRIVELSATDCLDLYGSLQPGRHVELIIADTGTGLSPEAQKKLFIDPFFTTKPRRRGFGLAMAYGILHAHRGGIRLHPGEERGVITRVLLPLAKQSETLPMVEKTSQQHESRTRGERILVVDDETDVLQYVKTSLEKAGYRVETATSGEMGCQLYFGYVNDPFRLVLTDVLMPGINGVEMVQRMLRRDPGVRVLFMSGHVSRDFTQQDLAPYNFELLSKPFRSEQLLRAVRVAIDRTGRRGSSRDGMLSPIMSSSPIK